MDPKEKEKQNNFEERAIEEPAFKPYYSEERKKELAEKTVTKLGYIKKVKELSKGEWLITQEILQEIQANLIAANPEGKMLSAAKLHSLLIKEVEERYNEDIEMKELLVNSIPSVERIREWLKTNGWEEAVWNKIRNSELFSKGKRSSIINALYKRAIDGSDVAAKIWLTLSGDYSDKMDINTDKRLEAYREINEILHKKKQDDN